MDVSKHARGSKNFRFNVSRMFGQGHPSKNFFVAYLFCFASVQGWFQENKLPIVSLFTGIGGLELGVHKSLPQSFNPHVKSFDLILKQSCQTLQLASLVPFPS